MAATNYVCLKGFTDDVRCAQVTPGMVVVFDPAIARQLAVVNSHIAGGVLTLATDTTNSSPVMVNLQKFATASAT